MSERGSTIGVGLVSHTNAGKTTLARTLLRQDIGEIGDRAHVTEVAERHVLLESPQGDVLALWDTPGFGDSMRLFKRLSQKDNPLGWVMSEVWDRFTDRPFWSGQQAIRSAREECDVVLYVINASELPEEARYIDVEMKILAWVGKPVLLVLNQVGPPRSAARAEAELALWRAHLASHSCVRGALTLDAFARCWVQEDMLLSQIVALLPRELQAAGERLRSAWHTRNLDVFRRSMKALSHQLAAIAVDEEPIVQPDVSSKIRSWVSSVATGVDHASAEAKRAEKRMTERLDVVTRAATDELIQLHGLSGKAATAPLQELARELAIERPLDEHKASLLVGALSGASAGIAADLAAGGLTFAAGALIGGVLGALGALGATQAYNIVTGRESGRVRWSSDFLTRHIGSALLSYLAVAHFGRGRGEFVSSAAPEHWQQALGAIREHKKALDAVWETARTTSDPITTEQQLMAAIIPLTRDVLVALYPESGRVTTSVPPPLPLKVMT